MNEDKTFGEITYESSNESVAKVNAATGEVTIIGVGTAVITATAAGSDNYDEASASYTLTQLHADGFPPRLRALRHDARPRAGAG